MSNFLNTSMQDGINQAERLVPTKEILMDLFFFYFVLCLSCVQSNNTYLPFIVHDKFSKNIFERFTSGVAIGAQLRKFIMNR